MTLFNDTICPAHEIEPTLRKYVMATTIITPKLIDLLDLTFVQKHSDRVKELIRDITTLCQKSIYDSRKMVIIKEDISPDILRATSSLYALWDHAAISASIKEKVHFWEICYSIAAQQESDTAPYELSLSPFAKSGVEYITLSTDEICRELLDYADEIEALLEEYFSEEYDEFNVNDEYDIFIRIQTGLEFLTQILSGEIPE